MRLKILDCLRDYEQSLAERHVIFFVLESQQYLHPHSVCDGADCCYQL